MASVGPITVPINFQMTDTSKAMVQGLVDEAIRKHMDTKARIAQMDAEINGPLIEVGRIYGKPLYIRDDVHDPIQLRDLVEQIQHTFRSAFYLTKEEK